MDSFSTLKSAVEKLVNAGQIDDAIAQCNHFLEFEQNSEALELLEQLQHMKQQQNQSIIAQTLTQAQPLWEKKDYGKLYAVYMKLYSIDPEYPGLEDLIVRVRNAIQAEQEAATGKVAQSAEEIITGFWKNAEFHKVIRACRELLDVDPTNQFAQKYLKKGIQAFLKTKITEIENEHLPKQQFKQAIDQLVHLVEEFGREKILIDALIALDRKIVNAVREQKNGIIQKGLITARALLLENKLAQAMDIVLQLEREDAQNASLKKFKSQLQKKIDTQLDSEVVKYLRDNAATTATDYHNLPDSYLAI